LKIEGDGKRLMMKVMMVMMIMMGNFWSQRTDDGFGEDILESSDVLIKSKLLSLSQVIVPIFVLVLLDNIFKFN
jgi:hypothetical protein